MASRDEVKAIVSSGYPDHFLEVSETVRITNWGANGDCPYLVANACSIYEMRPLRCRAYPVFQTDSGEIFLSICPFSHFLSDDDVAEFAGLLAQCPESFLEEASKHLKPHAKQLQKKLSRFRTRRLY